jgi:predicted RNA-binding Zn-ribbon protein involved in translation (DUF1610 family)
MIKIKLIGVVSTIIVLGSYGFGFAESQVPLVLKYELSFNPYTYASHAVTFGHARHAMEYKITCVKCHHTLEPGAIAIEKSCLECHGNKAIRNQRDRNVPKEERVQPYLIVLHNMCINCHKEIKINNRYFKVPVACWRCHIRKKR